jgi:hypothetical protein
MSQKQKKSSIRPEKGLEWLQRVENGESPPKIAKADKVDARTVRKHIDVARQERETKEARSAVLRNALEQHYRDLCRYAETLVESTPRGSYYMLDTSPPEPPVLYPAHLEIALREHLPRSPIWGYLNQIPKLNITKGAIEDKLGSMIEAAITSDERLIAELATEEDLVVPGIVRVLKDQLDVWIKGMPGLNVEDNMKSEPAENGFVNLRLSSYGLGKVKNEHRALVDTVITEWTKRIKEWPEYHELEKAFGDIQRVRKNLRDEIALIVLRRVVPGRCRYCPL